jgi:hypothetical protein
MQGLRMSDVVPDPVSEPKGSDKLPARARITLRKNATGELLSFVEDWTDANEKHNLAGVWYQWSEGNYSCDCNRSSYFDDDDSSCGDHRYSMIGFDPI